MKVKYLCLTHAFSCRCSDRLADAARVLAGAGVGALAVLDRDGHLLAMISERDLVRAMAEGVDPDKARVADYATYGSSRATLEEDSSAVGRRMRDAGLRHLPVVDSAGELVGMVSMPDLVALETWT
jgi:CBS domain-containing protein